MLILPQDKVLEKHQESKKQLVSHYNKEMEKILNKNSKKEKYWILGKVRFPDELGGNVGRSFLQACAEKPPVVKESFLYEVDNKRGVKTLLWVTHPDGSMRLPTLGKTIQVGKTQRKQIQNAKNLIL